LAITLLLTTAAVIWAYQAEEIEEVVNNEQLEENIASEDLFVFDIAEDFETEMRLEMDSIRLQHIIDMNTMMFADDTEKIAAFLEAVAQREAEFAVLDDMELHMEVSELARDVMFAGLEPAVPISVVNRYGEELMQDSRSGNMGISALNAAPFSAGTVRVRNVRGLLGVSGDEQITELQPNAFNRVRFDVVNGFSNARAVKAIVKLQNIETNAMRDVAIVEKTIAANSRDTITAGFNIPADAENYEIVIEL